MKHRPRRRIFIVCLWHHWYNKWLVIIRHHIVKLFLLPMLTSEKIKRICIFIKNTMPYLVSSHIHSKTTLVDVELISMRHLRLCNHLNVDPTTFSSWEVALLKSEENSFHTLRIEQSGNIFLRIEKNSNNPLRIDKWLEFFTKSLRLRKWIIFPWELIHHPYPIVSNFLKSISYNTFQQLSHNLGIEKTMYNI